MIVNNLLLVTNPFIEAFIHSDLLGKLIFCSLIVISLVTWSIVIYKVWITNEVKKNSKQFYTFLQSQKSNPLSCEVDSIPKNPFGDLYSLLKKKTVEILNKNRFFNNQQQEGVAKEVSAFLSPSDIEIVGSFLSSKIALTIKNLEKNLYILSTIVSLGPFLGLLGTVWGILTTFSELQSASGGTTNQMVLNGLSLALATTVLGLIDAIPALIGYNYLKHVIRDYETDMEGFSTDILASVEMHYRKVEN